MEDAGGGVEAEDSENETETPSQHESKRRKKNFKGHGKADRGTKTERGAGRGDKAVRNDEGGSRKYLGYSLILAMVLDKRPVMVRREDGFEKRVLWRCGRCRLVVGYLLDEVHYHTTSTTREEGDGGVGGEGRIKVVYLLPGGLVSTEEMRAGKGVGEKELMLGGG